MAVDKTATQPFATYVQAGIALTTSYQPVLQITGAGYLDSFLMQCNSGVITTVRVTVDGVIKFEGQANTGGRFVGVTRRSSFKSSGADTTGTLQGPSSLSGNYAVVTNTEVFGFPYTLNAAISGTTSLMTDSLYFNSSLLIEAKTASNTTVPYYAYGGTV